LKFDTALYHSFYFIYYIDFIRPRPSHWVYVEWVLEAVPADMWDSHRLKARPRHTARPPASHLNRTLGNVPGID